ncbi:thiamine pyrophosphate-binding protein [Kitasatospora sp. NPDC085879]|uniref:thiamine pyrophosphate-binding protein n=1 Tax=Kitasatospora sp. NPDC085879 TaxID=3154769 RepID=UPI000BB107D9|nr:thiamine pyrophosphate-binding protein [Streptomyces sp. TLI_235]
MTTTTTLAERLRDAGFDCALGVPDSHLTALIDSLDQAMPGHRVPREDAAAVAAVGMTIAGGRPLLYMKNAGLFTTGDALTSLAADAAVPLALLVGWAGTGTDRLPHHVVTGERPTGFLTGLGIAWTTPDRATDLNTWFCAHRDAGRHCALLVQPGGLHRWPPATPSPPPSCRRPTPAGCRCSSATASCAGRSRRSPPRARTASCRWPAAWDWPPASPPDTPWPPARPARAAPSSSRATATT